MRQWTRVVVLGMGLAMGCWESGGNKAVPSADLPQDARKMIERGSPGWTIKHVEKGKMVWGDAYYDVTMSSPDGTRERTIRYRPDQTVDATQPVMGK